MMGAIIVTLSVIIVLAFAGSVICLGVFFVTQWRQFLTGYEPLNIHVIMAKRWVSHYFTKFELYGYQDTGVRNRVLIELAERENDGRLYYLVGIFLHVDDPARASDFYRRAFESPGFPEEVKWQAVDGFITLALFSNPKPHLVKMDEYSQQLIAAKPLDLSVHGTRGSVLIELGRIEEGKRMLEGVLEKDENKFDRAISAAYLAYAAHLEQRPDDVAKYMAVAVENDPVNPILKRFAFLLPPEKKASCRNPLDQGHC